MSPQDPHAGNLKVCCPLCRGQLLVDADTGVVIKAVAPQGARKDFETALGELKTADQKREEDFLRAFRGEKKRAEILDKKFEQAREDAAKDDRKPFNPMDMD